MKSPRKQQNINIYRYLFATLLPSIFLCVISISYIISIYDKIKFTRSELLAIEDIQILYEAMLTLQEIRGMNNFNLSENGFKIFNTEQQNKKLRHLLLKKIKYYSADIHESVKNIVNENENIHHKINKKNIHIDPVSVFNEFSDLVFELYLQIRLISLKSNLLLDPELSTYSLIDLSTDRIPRISDKIGKIRAQRSSRYSIQHDRAHNTEIRLLYESLQEDLKRIQTSMEVINKNENLDYIDNIISLKNKLRDYTIRSNTLLMDNQTTEERIKIFQEGSDILEQMNKEHRKINDKIVSLLNERLNNYYLDLLITVSGSSAGLLLLGYFIAGFYFFNKRAFEDEILLKKELISSETRQRTIIETMVDGLIIINEKGIIQRMNPAAQKIFQYTSEEVTGTNVNALMPDPFRSEHDAYMQNYHKTGIKKIIGIGREVVGLRKDGSQFPLDLSVAEMRMGGERMYSGTVRDISERKKAQQDLTRFKSTLDQTYDSVFMFRPDTLKYFYANKGATEQIGYSFQEIMNLKPCDIKPEYDESSFRELIEPLITGNKSVIHFETSHEHKDGHLVPVEISLQYIKSDDDEPRFVAIVRDITERKRIDKMKNEFISTVSHELRTPLTSIRGSLGLISGGAVGDIPDQARGMLAIANNNTERLLLLINDILDIQKIESGQMLFNFKNISIIPFLEQAIQDTASYASQYGVKFVLNAKLNDAVVFADKNRLMQAMLNLLSNASKFSPEGDTVEITVSRHTGNQIRISVTDHGHGISDEFKDKVFDKFTQSDSSDSKAKGGTGLGLSITKIIIEKHGGIIDFISHRGIGTTFYIELPELTGETISENSPRKLINSKDSCILILEDDPYVAALLQRILAESGYDSDIAHTVDEARNFLTNKKNRYKSITIDLSLPGEDGLLFLNWLRSNPLTYNIPAVIVSAAADEARRNLRGGALRVVDWLQKPIDQNRLINAVSSVITNKSIPQVLHVEDEIDVHRIVKTLLQNHCELTWTTTISASVEALQKQKFDLVLLDINLPDGSGLDLLPVINEITHPPGVVIFSAEDVAKEYADKVSASLVKSNTSKEHLSKIIHEIIQSNEIAADSKYEK